VITHAVLCPGPPLLAPDLSGADPESARLRDAVLAAIQTMLADAPELVVVIGTADRTAHWPSHARADLHAYGGSVAPPAAVAPLSVGIGALLLDLCGYPGALRLQTVHTGSSTAECETVATQLAQSADRVGMVVVADGSARRTVKAPGYFDPRAEPYDAAVAQAIRSGELRRLHDLDPVLADELMASGWAALQVLGAAFGPGRPQTTIHYDEAPYGVGYLVASLVA
jgi:hypothetical protein